MKIDSARVRALRERRAWSQEQLAEVAGIHVRTVQRVEAGGSASLETRMALAAALEVGPEDLCEAAPMEDPAVRPSVPPPAALPDPAQVQHQKAMRVLLLALIVVLITGLGYQFGKDLARKHNRVDCEAAGRTDCR